MNDRKDWKVSKRHMKKAKTYNPGGRSQSHHGAAHQKLSTKAEKRRYDAVYKASKKAKGKMDLNGKPFGINEYMDGQRAGEVHKTEITAVVRRDLQRHIDAPRWKKIDNKLNRDGHKPKMFIGWASNVKNKTMRGVDFIPYGRWIASAALITLAIILFMMYVINN